MTVIILFAAILIGCGEESAERTPSPTPTPTSIPKETIRIGEKEISVEIADTPESRHRGLMFRVSLEKDSGMLFVFDKPGYHKFYMKNTRIPLSIAFIKKDGTIADIQDMPPFEDKKRYFPRVKVSYALEMEQGWFQENDVKPGDKVQLYERIKVEE